MNNTLSETILYSSSFSELTHNREKKLIIATWKDNSRKLVEQGVKDEIIRLLELVVSTQVENVIVDARHYYFTDNENLQRWINSVYVPQLVESGVKKYAFVVEAKVANEKQGTDTEDIVPRVEYFSSIQEAMNWIQ